MELIDLTKKVEQVLDLRKMTNVQAQVCLAIDYSGSMDTLYKNGTVQGVVNRIFAIAVKFDDNQELDVLVFSDGVEKAASCDPDMFNNYVYDHIIKCGFRMGGTNYAPFIRKVINDYFGNHVISKIQESSKSMMDSIKSFFGKKKVETITTVESDDKSISGYPIFVIVVTDGENFDKTDTTALLNGMQNKNVFFQFIGIGEEKFAYLKQISTTLSNVGFFNVKEISKIDDVELYEKLLNEKFCNFIKEK